jgi:hypothetical protein
MTEMIWGLVFSVFGLAYFTYGKKQDMDIPFYSGIILMIFPYFIQNLYIMISIGTVLVILPFVIRE